MPELGGVLFDFGRLAGKYDRWYDTRLGKAYDRLERKTVSRYLPRISSGGRLLDVGCGTGHWSRFFAARGFKVTGIDLSGEMIAQARSRKSPGCHFKKADARSLPFADGSFDLITAMTVLEFIPDPRPALQEMFRCLKPGGKVLLGLLNRSAPLNQRRLSGREEPYISGHLPTRRELRALLRPYGRVSVHGAFPVRPLGTKNRPGRLTPLRGGKQRRTREAAFLLAEVKP